MIRPAIPEDASRIAEILVFSKRTNYRSIFHNDAYSFGELQVLPLALELGISELLKKYPYEVSGGQKQRAAVCRALITHPRLILADEPTGALDSRATDALLDVFQQINQTGQTLLMVTHSLKAASRAGRILFIRDGQVYHQLYRGEMTNEQFYEKISDALTVMTRKDAMDGEMA